MMDFEKLSQFFIGGDVRGAMEYMRAFPEMKEILLAYGDLFVKEHYISYEIPEELDLLLLFYQQYFRNVFYCRMDKEKAASILAEGLSDKLSLTNASKEDIVTALKERFEEKGYQIQTGKTNGYFGPYVWKETKPTSFLVELPEGERSYSVNILSGFVMRSWMDYITFGRFGTKGWAEPDGRISCIEGAYDFESEAFRVSLLKHEAQHVSDFAVFPAITPSELEYRAKLVELIYSTDPNLLFKFLSEADENRQDDSHAMAAARIKKEMGDYRDKTVEERAKKASVLLRESTEELKDKYHVL